MTVKYLELDHNFFYGLAYFFVVLIPKAWYDVYMMMKGNEMSTFDCFVVFGPLMALAIGLAIAFGVVSYLNFKEGIR